ATGGAVCRSPWSQSIRQRCNACGQTAWKTRRKVSCDGMPWGSRRNRRKKSSFERPNASISTKSSQPHSTPQKPRARMSANGCCKFLHCRRGSGTVARASTKLDRSTVAITQRLLEQLQRPRLVHLGGGLQVLLQLPLGRGAQIVVGPADGLPHRRLHP